jgi:hypothetical protein
MLFTNRRCCQLEDIRIRGVKINPVSSFKFLGVIIDDRLSFADHISFVGGKVSKSCGIMSRLCKFLPADIMKRLYTSFVFPYLTYGVEIWGGTSKTHLAHLKSLQNRCVKFTSENVFSSFRNIWE